MQEYEIEIRDGGVRIAGVMRLASPSAYRAVLAGVHALITSGVSSFEMDVSGLTFLNSSGVTAISRLVLECRRLGVSLKFVVDDGVLWQRKTLPTLAKLDPNITLVPK